MHSIANVKVGPKVLTSAVAGLLVTAAGVFAATAQNQSLRAEADVARLEETISQFFDRMSFGEVDDAFNDLLAGSLIQQQAAARRDLIEKASSLETQFGTAEGFEQITRRRIGTDVVRLTYLYKCERYPIVWRFVYYRLGTSERWKLIAVRFDTDLGSLDI